jgi:hypothetical protein
VARDRDKAGLDTEPVTDFRDQQAAQVRSRLTPFAIVAIVAPGLVVIALPTVSMIGRNSEYFGNDYTAGGLMYASASIVILVGFVLWALSATAIGRFLFLCYVLITPGWFLYSTTLGWRRAVGSLVAASIVLVGAYFLSQSRDLHLVSIGVFGALVLVGTVAATFIEVGRTDAATPTQSLFQAPTTKRSSLPNVYHIVFDEFQTEMFETTLEDETKSALAGFTFFLDARTQWGRTQMSMASIFGPASYDYETDPRDFVDSALRGPDSSLELLRLAGYSITAYTHSESIYLSLQPFDQTLLFKDLVPYDPGSNYDQLAASFWVYSNLPGSVARRLISPEDYEQLDGQNLLPDSGPPLAAEGFRTFVNRERQLPPTGRYSLVHLLLPHFPYVLSEDCHYEAGVETTPSAQAACASHLIEVFLEELRALDRFDDSTIIIHGDHGGRFELNNDGKLGNIPSNFYSERWSDARSRSLLLIKPAGIDSSKDFEISDYPAELTDIMPTVFDSVDLELELRDGRTSLLGANPPHREVRFYHFYDKRDDHLPDGEVVRFVISEGAIAVDRTISLPKS